MANQYSIVLELTSRGISDTDRSKMLNDFAYELGWQPSDRLGGLTVGDFANTHLETCGKHHYPDTPSLVWTRPSSSITWKLIRATSR